MKLPIGRMTDGIAVVTLLCFFVLYAIGQVDFAALVGGVVPVRWAQPEAFDGLWAVPLWLTPLSATLIHAGWMHIGFNLLMLIFCGRQVEHVLGRWLTLLLYVAGAYGAAFAQWAVDPLSANPMIGASGAISALMATYALLYSRQNVRAIGPFSAGLVRVLWLAAAWIILQLMIGLASTGGVNSLGQIAFAAHIGGFIVGLALTRPLLRLRFKRPQPTRN